MIGRTVGVIAEPKKYCRECNLPCYLHTVLWCWTDPFTTDHIDLCCDCYDESFGMPEDTRSRKRPE